MDETGHTDDGSEKTIASSKFVTNDVFSGIGKCSEIELVKIQVPLKDSSEINNFKFSKTWKVPRIVFCLTGGPLALENGPFIVSDGEFAAENVLLALTLLKHLGIDTKTMLENIATNLMVLTVSIFNQTCQTEEWGKVTVL